MELVKLNANNQPYSLLENYDSLIWTERFNTIGDFQLTTGDTSRFMTELPEGTRLSLRDSNHTMIVETHKIERKKNSAEVLTITGRSFESILDRRVALTSLATTTGDSDYLITAQTPSDAAFLAIYNICVEGLLSAKDIFPSSMVGFPTPADFMASTSPFEEFTINRGSLLSAVIELISTDAQADITTTPVTEAVVPHGIRALRPAEGSTAIAVQIYKGVDRSETVYFDARRDLLEDGAYLFSKVGSSNVGYGVGADVFALMFEGENEPEGLDRRVMLVDASNAPSSTEEGLRIHMASALSDAHETAMFDGSINPDLNPYIYGVDYNLGDTVRIVGDFNLDTKARVTEFIRTEDATGEKAYPTLEAISNEEDS